jgi:superfamily II DNA or RNA helicase
MVPPVSGALASANQGCRGGTPIARSWDVRLLFDRGTILLCDLHPDFDASDIPGVLWDPRVQVYRTPAYRHQVLRSELTRRALSFSDEVRGAQPPLGSWSPIELRPYQEAALWSWELARRRALVVLPTGSGKTRLALAAMARAGSSALCLVPTRVLLAQWLREIARVYAGPVGCYGDGVRELASVTVATFESAYRHMDRLGNRFDLLVVDEAHHFGCGMRDEALEMSTADARLGLTATPPHDVETVERLSELVGRTAYELTIGDLVGRFLAGLDVVTLHLDLTAAERQAYESWMTIFRTVHGQFRRVAPVASWEDFARTAARTADGRHALDAFRRARRLVAFTEAKREMLGVLLRRHRAGRILIFTADNESAYAIAREHLVMPFTCDIGRREREEVLIRFREGTLRALVSARVLNEGIDVPDADVGVVVGGALGQREHVQRVGRLLRPREGKRALVYELVSRKTTEVRLARRRRAGIGPRGAAAV